VRRGSGQGTPCAKGREGGKKKKDPEKKRVSPRRVWSRSDAKINPPKKKCGRGGGGATRWGKSEKGDSRWGKKGGLAPGVIEISATAGQTVR